MSEPCYCGDPDCPLCFPQLYEGVEYDNSDDILLARKEALE